MSSKLKVTRSHEASLEARTEDGQFTFMRKFDGCLHVHAYSNGATPDDAEFSADDVDYIHICNVEEFIDFLQQLQVMSKERGWDLD